MSKETKETLSKEKGWAASLFSIGFLLILLSVVGETLLPAAHPADAAHAAPAARLTHLTEIGLTLLEHLGVAVVVVAIVGVIVDFDDWRKYFQERVAETIINRNYLRTLDADALVNLQTDALKAFFKVDDIDRKGSFLEYFHTKIRDFIRSPFRENTTSIVSLRCLPSEPVWLVEETINYTCRKVGDFIQEDVRWFLDPGEGEVVDFSVSLHIPKDIYDRDDFKRKYQTVTSPVIEFEKGHPALEPAAEGEGFRLPLKDYREIDGLVVKVCAQYRIKAERLLTWKMTHPSNRVSLTLTYPPHLELFLETFGMARDDFDEDRRVGLHSIWYDSWLLPYSGFTYQFYDLSRADDALSPPAGLAHAGVGLPPVAP